MKRDLDPLWPAWTAAVLGLLAVSGRIQPIAAQESTPSTASAMTQAPPVDSTSRQLGNLKVIVPKDAKGGFIAPRFSPDGLQLMLSRAGFQGIYVVAAAGGTPRLVAEASAINARWTKDGLIGIRQDKELRVLNLDGTSARTEAVPPESVYCERDRVYAVPENGAAPVPVTDNSDRFIEPKLCPLHKGVAYIGVETGLYISRADGTGAPRYLGPGEDVSWGPGAAFLIFARTRDDGHALVEGDLYYYDTRGKQLYNLTASTDLLLKSPALSPDGKTVALECEGAIYTGTLP
jgi:outer membrane protein assembly factor BamB